MNPLGTIELSSPKSPVTSSDTITTGQQIPALDRIKLFSDRQWEDFVLEWADSLRGEYFRVDRCGGAGDMGRDIIASINEQGEWDNYQCKHYKDPLQPHHIWVELGKLIYYTKLGEYSYPRRYIFVAPQGAGTKLLGFLKDPDKLRTELLAHWDSHCRNAITTKATVELDEDLHAYIESLDFSIFHAKPPLHIIDEHAKTRWHAARFGGGLPQRPALAAPPTDVSEIEAVYTRQLLDAYGDHLGHVVATPEDMPVEGDLRDHFQDSRLEFYSAESLRAFSRDTLPPGEFDNLQEEIFVGVKDDVRADYDDGYSRVVAVVKSARALQITSHPLISRLTVRDRGGICHQLANDEKVKWVK